VGEQGRGNADYIAEVIETKLDQLIESVKEIKDQMHDNSVDISNLKLEINSLQNKNEQQQKEIDKLYEKNDKNKGYIMGVAIAVVTTIVIGIIKLVAGVI